MRTWRRIMPLDGGMASTREEIWEERMGDRTVAHHPIRVRVGKPLDVVALKRTSLQDIRDYSSFLRRSADSLYGKGGTTRVIPQCPCCGRGTGDAPKAVEIFGVCYHRCVQCGHAFVRCQPTEATVHEVFANSEQHAAVYTDKASAEARIEMVVAPKIDWMTEVFVAQHGRKPISAVDVGAGGGHFVAGLGRAGITGIGFELSRTCRQFAKDMFGVMLEDGNFANLTPQPGRFDILTLWGLLEYVPEPRRLLDAARRWFADSGMLVVEVPRYECLGTTVQAAAPTRVARHLDPTSHLNCFSDASLATALSLSGFRPVAAWYFGMDAYEAIVQLSLELESDAAFDRLAPLIPQLQSCIDSGLLCDDIVVAAVPA